jgi:predicted O-methyltransferase YrrM
MEPRTSGPGKVLLKYPPNEWQIIDRNGYVMPWYSDRFLRELNTWDVSAWRVLEYGAGYSTLWWASRARQVLAVEHDEAWVGPVNEGLQNCQLSIVNCQLPEERGGVVVQCPAGSGFARAADQWPGEFDCCIVDGAEPRHECLAYAVGRLKAGGVLILDNTEDTRAEDLPGCVKYCRRHDYPMTDHPRCTTTYWTLDERREEIPPPQQWRVPMEHPERLVLP